jgi:hypothetical protein
MTHATNRYTDESNPAAPASSQFRIVIPNSYTEVTTYITSNLYDCLMILVRLPVYRDHRRELIRCRNLHRSSIFRKGGIMKVPFRQQATMFDCVPTSFINAMCYLFSMEELPPFVVQRVYKECLDYESARGTTSRAMQDLAFWLNCYMEKRFKSFAVSSKYIYGDQVHLRRNNRITKCLDRQGVVLICLNTNFYDRHCILGIYQEDNWLYCYDPHPRTKRYINNDSVQFIEHTKHQTPNLKIRINWLETNFDNAQHADERKYVFGSIDSRECVLINRIRR